MSERSNPKIEAAIIKVVGIFDYNKKFLARLSAELGFESLNRGSDKERESTEQFYRDKYYKEFNELMLTQNGENAVQSFSKKCNHRIQFVKRGNEIVGNVSEIELHLFENQIGVFSISVDAQELEFNYVSDLLYFLKMFSAHVKNENVELHEWISKYALDGISLRSNPSNFVDSDEYSGSKFKIYSAFSVDETVAGKDYNRDHLLYEIGTGSMLGSVASVGYFTPSPEYFKEIMKHRVSAFNSSAALALLDSYTVIGQNLFYANGAVNPFNFGSYNRIYFSIYLFNLHLKYNVFRFNAKFKDDPVQYKARFEDFMNEYNFSHISFDFLPNLIYSKMRAALGVELEVKNFEKRLKSLAANIQEEQEKRQAALLGIISIISSISAIDPILETAEEVRDYMGMENELFYVLASVVSIAAAIPILTYLFPHHSKKVWKTVNAFFKND
jgi:hypothetical protein